MFFLRQDLSTAAWLVAAVLLWADAAAAQHSRQRIQKVVELPELTAEELVVVALDSDVHEASSPDYSDLRLQDSSGAAIPFLLRTAAQTRSQNTRQHRDTRLRSAQPLAGNSLEILIDLPDTGPQPQGIQLISPLKDFQHRVRVFASADGEQWQPLTEDGLIFDYSRFIDVRNDSVSFVNSLADDHKQLRIVIDDVTAEQQSRLLELTRELVGEEETSRSVQVTVDRRPLKIDKVQLWHEVEQLQVVQQDRIAYPLAEMSIARDEQQGQTLVTVQSRREPLTQLTLTTPSRNFSRHVSVEVPHVQGVRTLWQPIGSGVISNLNFKALQRQQLSIAFPENRHRQYRLVIADRDNPTLEISEVRAEGSVKELVFFASPEQRLTLAFGENGERWQTPSFDTSAITAALAEGYQPQQAVLASRVERLAADAPPLDLQTLLNRPGVLIGIIALLVAVLGWFLYQAGRQLDAAGDHHS